LSAWNDENGLISFFSELRNVDFYVQLCNSCALVFCALHLYFWKCYAVIKHWQLGKRTRTEIRSIQTLFTENCWKAA